MTTEPLTSDNIRERIFSLYSEQCFNGAFVIVGGKPKLPRKRKKELKKFDTRYMDLGTNKKPSRKFMK